MAATHDMKWNARLYDDKHNFVFRFGEDVVQLLHPRQGERILEMGGKANIEDILVATRNTLARHGYYSNAAIQPWYFPSLAEYTTLLEHRGFRIQFAAHFDRPTPLQDTHDGIKDWIRMFGSAFFTNIPDNRIGPILDEIQEALKPTHYKDHTWFADYKRLRIEAIKQY